MLETETTNKQLIYQYFEQINLGNLAVLTELCAPNLVHHTTHSPQPLRGLEQVLKLATSYQRAFPDLTYTLNQVLAEGDSVAIYWTATGHHRGSFQGIPPTGKRCTLSGMSIYRFEEGKIAERWVMNDDLGMLGELGLPRWLLAGSVVSSVLPAAIYNKVSGLFAKSKNEGNAPSSPN